MPIITRRHEMGDHCVAELGEDIGADNCQLLRDELNGLIDVGCTKIVLDFAGVNFVASAGFGVLIRFLQKLEDIPDSRLCLCSLNDQIKDAMERARILNFFEVRANSKECLSSVRE